MIGSFWNLCRACPSMPVDKLHSEYRSTYKWHEYTGNRQEVVRRPPQANTGTTGCKMEPAMPRRKKHPELAYRTHEFLAYEEDGSNDSVDVSIRPDRARSEERTGYHLRSSRRSRSEGPPRGPTMNSISCRNEITRRRDSDPDLEPMGTADEGGLLRKAISKISTEYRLQFAWPPGHNSRADSHQAKDGSLPRKSLSMGAIKPSAQSMVHKKHNELDTKDVSELEPLVNDSTVNVNEKNIRNEKYPPKDLNTEYKKKFRPFSQYDYLEEGRFANKDDSKMEQETLIETKENGPNLLYGKIPSGWFKEVVELRKKAGEYKHRGWGTELAPEHISELYNKQIELWEQVSRRSSLSALSLASTTRKPYTKEEKEEENNKKSSPSKAVTNARNVSYRKGRDSIDNSTRAVKEIMRHHLERTTGGSEYDGLILSPTREKLEPTIPKRNEDHRDLSKENQQRSSPKKDSPQKSKRATTTKTNVRSQSVGPTDVTEKSSPKRLSRSTTVRQQKTPRDSTSSPPSSTVRRPRPSDPVTAAEKCTVAGPGGEEENCEQADMGHVVKSPPEPTRVKSPEQIMMRSPDPVNWTVPLDTGKTFTVTQNVREGELMNRPHSEVKAWTPPDVPPPAAQSAPPELAEQAKEPLAPAGAVEPSGEQSGSGTTGSGTQAWKAEATPTACPHSNPATAATAATATPPTPTPTTPNPPQSSLNPNPNPTNTNPTTTSTTATVENPSASTAPTPSRSLASDVLEKARTRFDEFWGKNKQDSRDENM